MKLKIKGKNSEETVLALVNSGFEASEPHLIIPLETAEKLGFTSSQTDLEDFDLAGGGKASGYRVRGKFEVELELTDRNPVSARTLITMLPGENEAIMSDYLASELKIVILDAQKGEWCLRDEIGKKKRKSAVT